MGLLSSFRKKQQESSVASSNFYSQADEVPAGRRRKSSKRDESVDPVLPKKKRARRRLVGAIALVLAVVIGLPMILDPEAKPLPDDINIQIPSRNTPAPAPAAKPETELVQTAALAPEEEVDRESRASKIGNSSSADNRAVSRTRHSTSACGFSFRSRTQADRRQIGNARAQASRCRRQVGRCRTRGILGGKAVAAAPQSAGKIAIQVAALASQDKVNELQKKLQSAGLKSYTQKVTTSAGSVIRVRVGPFANEAEAKKAQARLTKLSLSGKLVPA